MLRLPTSRLPMFLHNPDGSINQSHSFPSGQWQAQSHNGGRTNIKDPWIGLHRPTSYAEAHRQLVAEITRSAPRPS